ncbi:Otoferlin, partial [Frankliniella fusca]
KFTWPLARALDEDEVLKIHLLSHSRFLGNRLLGSLVLVLQQVLVDGRVTLTETLVDANYRELPATVALEVSYQAPDASTASWGSAASADGYQELEDDQQMLIDIEQNIANLERTLSQQQQQQQQQQPPAGKSRRSLRRADTAPSSTNASPQKSPAPEKKSRGALRSVRAMMRLGKSRPKDSASDTEEAGLLEGTAAGPASGPVSRASSQTSLSSNESQASAGVADRTPTKKVKMSQVVQSALKAQDFQVCLTVIEARQLAGLNMDPVVCIQVGDQRKYTSVKESTNCPYYNEYFVFDFHMPPIMLFDKIITLSVLHSRTLFLRCGTVVGSFKIDLRTVYDAPDHQFYHKWALLTDPDDIAAGPKGYLKCDISVIGKGDTVKIPPKSEKDEDDIEANLLLPDGVPVERQRAKFIIRVYRADGLPKMNSSIMANVKRAFTGEAKDLVDPYVQVSFAGMTGKTSVRRNCYAPVWNEQIVFNEMFPPLCQRIKLQLRDNDPVNNTVIGTHFLDLKTISNDGDKGFLPTFGPAFVHLYGSTRDYSLIDEHASLNAGLGEGVSYRARILVSVRTEITDSVDMAPSDVEVEPAYPINESSYGKNEEFFLFATILDASMIDKKLGDKPMYFELSIGNAGNTLDGHNESAQEYRDAEEEDAPEVVTESSWQSTTTAIKPMTHDRLYYFLPYWDDKPCMHVRSVWPDLRRRMYNSNVVARVADRLEEGLAEVHALAELEDPAAEAERRLRAVLDDLSAACARYVSLARQAASQPGAGKTKLDRERARLCEREIEHIGTMARNLKALVTKHSFKERYKTAQTYLNKLKFLVEDPQHALPDIFLWLISNNKRTAYQRIPARDLIYSMVAEECGRDCGKVQTMFLKLPGKRGLGPSGWAIQTKLQVYMWLGTLKHKKNFVDGLTKGYELSNEIRNADRPRAMPPSVIHYTEKRMRAYMYQARSLIGSDASGLSDPFARVVIGEYCRTTQVIDETLSPTWDELLVFDDVLIYGTREEIKKDPPTVIIEIFDQDKVGKSEFIGRAMAKPHVKMLDEAYAKPEFPPSLEWYEISRGPDHAGELLATFELLEVPQPSRSGAPAGQQVPDLPTPKDTVVASSQQDKGPVLPVPRGIRPTLAKYRIEVLFWGLRDLKRVHLMKVDHPRVDIECAGHILYSSVIQNAKKNPNFSTPVKFLDLELPEQELYRPPLTIRAVDCRSFGRYTLVGTHMINTIHKYMYTPLTKREREAEERKRSLQQLQNLDGSAAGAGHHPTVVISHDDHEMSPLISKETAISLDYGTGQGKRVARTNANRKQRKQSVEDADGDEGSRDWWTKYFASVEAMIEESKEARKETQLATQQNGLVHGHGLDDGGAEGGGGGGGQGSGGGGGGGAQGAGGGGGGSGRRHSTTASERSDHSHKKKGHHTLKGTATAAKFVAKLSPKSARRQRETRTALTKVYPNELEAQPDYNGFKEWLLTFDLLRGKKTGDEAEDESRVVGVFKGAIKVYRWPLPKDGLPSNEPIHVLVRVYVVKANDLHPMDLNGKADPYIVLQLGSKRISDKENYISKQLNPVFGKCFEFEATFPQDSMLTVQILDWDLVGSDDLIGETRIDLENRFYSRHRATCGIAAKYEDGGYNQWRDPMKPTQILAKLCKDGKLEPPVYSNGKVKVGRRTFFLQNDDFEACFSAKVLEEHMALAVLHRWHEFPRIGCQLVPEHIETRPLYNAEKPGIEQGKLEMWVDMFPMDMPLPGPPLDISPRKPKSYELRVVIWNTDDVVLEDDAFFTGEKMSDIYVKGWLKGPEDCQCTDIHYRSLTGEGNFNWRFVFPFDYLVAEEKIVISRKESMFSWDETECKIPARLELQVWDADHFSADDFLGAITLDLNRFPRGAKSSKLCTLSMLRTDVSVPMVNIFKQKRVKGWWPFYVKKENEEMELTGKVEAEIHLLTKEEAEKNPAGLGRNEPDPLEKPNRPDASFMWFLNPLKSIRYIVWHNYKWAILKVFIVLAVAVMLLLFFYSVPGYTVKKIMGA